MRIKIIEEHGYSSAMLGLSLSHGQPIEKMPYVAEKLCYRDGGHNKFLESIAVWMDITAPRYWWQQFDTYRIGVTKQSGSTMHTLMLRPLKQEDFEIPISGSTLIHLNYLIEMKWFDKLKNELPEGYLQRRIICTNYKSLRNIINQRSLHRLNEWHIFCNTVLAQVEHSNFLRRE